jgi:hypothetical protein
MSLLHDRISASLHFDHAISRQSSTITFENCNAYFKMDGKLMRTSEKLSLCLVSQWISQNYGDPK